MNYHSCHLCPRNCGVDRTAGQLGFCGQTDQVKIARAAPHFWEEPVLCGESGSGTVFFSGCTMGCVFCQNDEISHQGLGREAADLRKVFENLIEQGVSNINLVTATQFLPSILPALTPKLPVPVVYNCGGYESVETLKQLEGLVDIYLPDMKYSSNALAKKLSHAPDYVETASAAILEMYRQVGKVQMENGILKKGMILRHLILPNEIDNALGVLDWVDEHFQPGEILFSLMSQYVPMGRAKTMEGLNRPITEMEYDAVLSYMELLGIEDGFTQEFSSAVEEYIPDWDFSGL